MIKPSLPIPPAWRLITSALVFAVFPLLVCGQSSFTWTTNFYAVTGANFREIRQSINRSRPWKDPFDGITHWNVEWRCKLNSSPHGCSASGFTTQVKIVTTLPRWTPPAGVVPEVKAQWTRFFVALAQHEAGHARIGRAAAAKVDETIRQAGVQADCDTVQRLISERAESVLAEHRRQDEEYDRRTDHGRKPAGTP